MHGAAGRHAYVGVADELHVIDLETGETVRRLPRQDLRLLDPGRR